MEYEIRTIRQEELEAFRQCQSFAFGRDYNPEHLEAGRQIFEFDRNHAAFDATELVGTCGIFSTEMNVPGGSLPVAAVTNVSVAPTHRRRGIAAGLMRRQLEHIRERESIAALWASESSIYGRFGYGVGIEMEILRLPRVYSKFRDDLPPTPGRVRKLGTEEARDMLPQLHERLRREHPGEIARRQEWWDVRIFRDLSEWSEGYSKANYIVYESGGAPTGYVRYRTKASWDDWGATGRLLVNDFYAADAEATVGLWRYLVGVDLIETIEVEVGGTADPLIAMLAEPRRIKRTRSDAIWLRIVDVERALSGRALGAEGKVTFEVSDRFLDGVGGTFELEGGPGGAACRRTSSTPELRLGIEELSAVYLGGASLDQFARAGRVTGNADALGRAHAMFGWYRPPHCQEHF